MSKLQNREFIRGSFEQFHLLVFPSSVCFNPASSMFLPRNLALFRNAAKPSGFFRGLLLSACVVFAEDSAPIQIGWTNRFLTISGPALPAPVSINYLEAYCRPGSTDRDWGETVISHKSVMKRRSPDGRQIVIQDILADGVVVDHVITASTDAIDFQLTAYNPATTESKVHWAQPCMRVDKFTGSSTTDARAVYPEYIKKCFLFIDNKLTRLPTAPWALQARYTPGQVYCPANVDRNDVNPRPLSVLVPSNGLCGCFSADEKKVLAVAWEPYQEIFQGVITCMHDDFRIGGLKPGETKKIRGKIYVLEPNQLWPRFQKDFPEQAEKKR